MNTKQLEENLVIRLDDPPMTNHDKIVLSIAISFKRIADILEKQYYGGKS